MSEHRSDSDPVGLAVERLRRADANGTSAMWPRLGPSAFGGWEDETLLVTNCELLDVERPTNDGWHDLTREELFEHMGAEAAADSQEIGTMSEPLNELRKAVAEVVRCQKRRDLRNATAADIWELKKAVVRLEEAMAAYDKATTPEHGVNVLPSHEIRPDQVPPSAFAASDDLDSDG